MHVKLTFLLIAFTLLAAPAGARVEYPKTFAERAFAGIPTPSAVVAHEGPASANQYISLANPVKLPGANPWEAARPMPQKGGESRLWLPFFIGGLVLCGVGFIVLVLSSLNGTGTAPFELAATIALVLGLLSTATGIYLKVSGKKSTAKSGLD